MNRIITKNTAMKRTILTSAFALMTGVLLAQNALEYDFSKYLTDNGLWDEWRANRARFECPKPTSAPINTHPTTIRSSVVSAALTAGTVLPYTHTSASAEDIELGLEQRAQAYKTAYQEDPKYFQKRGLEVLSVLERLPPEIKKSSKIIVTDITGSMSPYAEQVLLWHKLNLVADEGNKKYVFFNDGDAKSDYDKNIGDAGGVYVAEGNQAAFLNVIATMQKGMRAGIGGDMPENDVEALLKAQEIYQAGDRQEIVLIADGTSTVRDLELIVSMELPVRVILCGVANNNSPQYPNVWREYALIAHITGGSMHTIERDIWDLSDRVQGEVFYMEGKKFGVRGKELLRLKD